MRRRVEPKRLIYLVGEPHGLLNVGLLTLLVCILCDYLKL